MDPIIEGILKHINSHIYLLYEVGPIYRPLPGRLATLKPLIYGIYSTEEKAREALIRYTKKYENYNGKEKMLFISSIQLDQDKDSLLDNIFDVADKSIIEYKFVGYLHPEPI